MQKKQTTNARLQQEMRRKLNTARHAGSHIDMERRQLAGGAATAAAGPDLLTGEDKNAHFALGEYVDNLNPLEQLDEEGDTYDREDADDYDFSADEDISDDSGEAALRGETPNVPSQDLLRLYFRDVARIPRLSDEETIRVAKRIEAAREAKDSRELEQAKAELVTANLRLVISIAKTFSHCSMPFTDLIQAGNLGLMKAADGFDYKMGFKFSTYASNWIKASIRRTISNQLRTVRIPVSLLPVLKQVESATRNLKRKLGRHPTTAEIARSAHVDDAKVRLLGEIPQAAVSFDFTIDGEAGRRTVGDTIPDKQSRAPFESSDLQLVRKQLEGVMHDVLDRREREVLMLRYGLADGIRYTQAEIAACLDLSRQRVSQIELRALMRLRAHRQIISLKDFFN